MHFPPLEYLDEPDEIDAKAEDQGKVCGRCGMRGLHWEETHSGWRLHDDDGLHVCKRSK